MNGDRQKITGGEKGRDQQHNRAEPGEDAGAGSQGTLGKIPLADKAARGRNADQAEGSECKAPDRDRHLLADALQFTDLGLSGLMNDGAGSKEQRGLDGGVEDDMQERSGQGSGLEHKDAHQHIGNL